MTLLPLNALRAFEAAARLLSFSRAGDELHVTHAAISHQVRNLEDWIGRPLFERDGRGIRLTRLGAMLQSGVAHPFQSLAEACRQVRATARTDAISVGCIPSIAVRWLVPRLTDFTRQHPDIDIRVLYARAEERLADGDLDVLVTLGSDPTPGTVSRPLFSRISRPVCSPHYLRRCGPIETPEAIARAALLHDETREAWQEWFRSAGLRTVRSLSGPVFQDFNLLATAVIAGHGVALCPVEVFRGEIAGGDLVVLSDVATDADRSYCITSRHDAPKAVEDFVAWFIAATVGSAASPSAPGSA